MKSLLAASAIAIATLAAMPAIAASPFAGNWALTSSTTDADKRTIGLFITEAAGKLGIRFGVPANVKVPAGAVIPTWAVSGVTVKGNVLSFKAIFDSPDAKNVSLNYTLTAADGKLTGTVKSPNDERQLVATKAP